MSPQIEDYRKESETYEAIPSNKTISKIEDYVELLSGHCSCISPCNIDIQLDIEKIEKRETMYRLNQKMKEKLK